MARGTVLWLGIANGGHELAALAAEVGAATGALGFEGDARSFQPHLTVARAPRPRDLRALAGALGGGPTGPPWTVDEIVLLESDTQPEGAVYRTVAHVPVGT
jgi:RNA 2',3'-cyclic 3'-phosphodiesterase